MTRGENFMKKASCKHGHRAPMTNSAWCDLNKDCTVLKSHDMCHNPKCIRQNQITFNPKQLQLESSGFKNTKKSFFKRSQTAWNKLLKPAVNVAALSIDMVVGAKTKNKQVGQATTNIMKSISRGRVLILTDLHGNGLRLKLM